MSQVNFFKLPEDESEFVRMLEARGDTRPFPMRALATPAANQTYRRWYDALARWIWQRYGRQDGWWVSPRAKAWWQEGNLLSFGGRSEGRAFGREAES